MSIMELGALGEFLGFFGIMLTLGYLGYQTRQNSNSLRAANIFNVINASNSQNLMIAADERMLRLMIAGMNEPDSLGPEDLLAAQLMIRGYANVFQGAYSIRNGIPDDYWEGVVRANAGIASTRGGRQFYEENRELYGPEYMKLIDSLTGDETKVHGLGFAD